MEQAFAVFQHHQEIAIREEPLGFTRADHCYAPLSCVKNLKKIQAQRTMIQQVQVVDNQVSFDKVMKSSRLAYILKMFTRKTNQRDGE